MFATPSPEALAAPATTALAAALQQMRRRAGRSALVLALLCAGVALILTAIAGRGFGHKLVYSLCIGVVCMLLVDATRLLSAAVSDRLRRARGLPFDLDPAVTGWRGVMPGVLLALLLGPTTGLWIGDRLTGLTSPNLLRFGESNTRITLAFSLAATLISVAVMSTLERLSSARAQAQAAQRLAAENQLRLLQSQLEPHMLFNTLANLRVLIGLDPARAQAMLDRLIAFLRTTLDASRRSTQPLSTEFAHLADYLALMAVRMGARLAVRMELPPELEAVPVPPLLLQPLVENAIKHGLEPKVEGGRIDIRAWRESGLLHLTVRDTGVGLGGVAAAAGASFGLEQVRARLDTLYGSAATLALTAAPDAEGGALVSLRMPITQP